MADWQPGGGDEEAFIGTGMERGERISGHLASLLYYTEGNYDYIYGDKEQTLVNTGIVTP